MSIVWKIIRIIGLYVVSFFVCVMIAAIALDSLPDAIEALFALLAPIAFVWWYEKRRTARLEAIQVGSSDELSVIRKPIQLRESARVAAGRPEAAQPEARRIVDTPERTSRTFESPKEEEAQPVRSRTKELREKLFGDDTSIFDTKNAQRVEEIRSRIPPEGKIAASPVEVPDRSTPPTYRPRQDNAELIRVGKAAKEALEAASMRRAAERERGDHESRQSALSQSPATAGRDSQDANGPSRIKELRKKLLGDVPGSARPAMPLVNAAPRQVRSGERPSPSFQGWIPKGTSIFVKGRKIDGMVYFGVAPKSNGYGERCRAYIDPSLSVATSGSDKRGENMPYWPGYSTIPAVCRATYLDWLADGRQDGTINPGYMFLFFYGLERRFLKDDPPDSEKQEIIAEVRRLRRLFDQNYSAQRYLGEFLDLASIIMAGGIAPEEPDLKSSILENRGWELPLALKVAIGTLLANGNTIDADWMYLWFVCHPETRIRTSGKRCPEEFRALFSIRYATEYPKGAIIRTPKRKLDIVYRAASGEFTGKFTPSSGESGNVRLPDISDLRSPVQGAQVIADKAMDDLDKYSRYLGRNPDGRGSIEAQALLPAELWGLFPSEELEELKDWAREQVAAGGLVPALDVISRLEGETPEKLGKRNLTGAADALARIGFGMAPDPRFSLRGPKIDEPVVIFELGEPVEQLENVSPAYRNELFELALATFVAHADSKIVEAERRALREKIDAVSGLTELERKRLHANLEWYLDVPPDMSWLRSKLKDADAEHHLALRAAVVAIAHADSVIQSEEVACIEKIYKALGIDAGLVYADLHAGDVPDGPVRVKAAEAEAPGEQIPDEPKAKAASLDAARIAAIRNDTERVSSVLGEIFSTDEDVSDEIIAAHALPSSIAGLDPKHAMLVEQIIQREHWTDDEFDELVGKQGLMSSGALEVINEWAFDKFDEALLDEYDGYDVSPDIADTLRAEMAKGD